MDTRPKTGSAVAEGIRARRGGAVKWTEYGPDVLPAWVADMDFDPPKCAIDAVLEIVARGDVGYHSMRYREEYEAAYTGWARGRFGAAPKPLRFLPDVMSGLFWAMRTLVSPNAGVVILVPSYPPFYEVIGATGHRVVPIPLGDVGGRFEIDFDRLATALADPSVEAMILCNPHNPTGRVFGRDELLALAGIALRNEVIVISDEIHHDLLRDGRSHAPFNSLDHEAGARSVVLAAPSKTFNLAGLKAAHLEVSDPDISARLAQVADHDRGEATLLGLASATAAFREGSGWLEETLGVIGGNVKAALAAFQDIPKAKVYNPEGTYLLWGRVEGLGPVSAFDFFLREARVAVSPGETFAAGASNWFRLNLATYPEVMSEILDRMSSALA